MYVLSVLDASPCGGSVHWTEMKCALLWPSCEFSVYYIWILLPGVFLYPHLAPFSFHQKCKKLGYLTFLNVLSPARILPPVHVVYFLSGGANILIRISLTASRCTSCKSLSPKPFVKVQPPERTILPYSDFLKSISARLIASTTIWWIPEYSSPINSGLNSISGARNRSTPISKQN